MAQPEETGEWPLESQRAYLLLLARCQLPLLVRAQFDPADVVQETLLRAHRSRHQFQGENEAQFRAWLRTILKNILAEAFRRLAPPRGDGRPPVSLQQALEESSCRLEMLLAADHSTPSQRVVREENLIRLAEALARLPDDQRAAIQLHHLDGLSLADVGRHMGRSKEAIAGLLFRGLQRLRERLWEPHEGGRHDDG
jgi:RNA polymerase sigma-70 factor (ECF subfamily)